MDGALLGRQRDRGRRRRVHARRDADARGRGAKLEPLRAGGRKAARSDDDAKIEGLLDAVSRARFGPQAEGLPASGSMVWLITHTTVRASQSAAGVDLRLPASPPAKKRAAFRAAPRPGPIAV